MEHLQSAAWALQTERPLRLNFQASAERIARLDDENGFKNLATSVKKDPAVREREIEAGSKRQDDIRTFFRTLGGKLYKDREAFLSHLRKSAKSADLHFSAPGLKAVLAAFGERDETAEICRDAKGEPEPDADLRDTETVPLKKSIEAYFKTRGAAPRARCVD